MKSQAALLRFLQDGSYRPLGSKRAAKANIRVIAASNQPLEPLIERGTFRRDLFYRLDVLSVEVPPLRQRDHDTYLLAEYFIEQFRSTYGGTRKRLSSRTLAWMLGHSWPGNIRELQNFLHRLYILSDGTVMDAAGAVTSTNPTGEVVEDEIRRAFRTFQDEKNATIDQFERKYLTELLVACAGNISLAARRAGKERSAFGRLMRKHRLSGSIYRAQATKE